MSETSSTAKKSTDSNIKIRVISDTTTFYPVEIKDEETHHRNDNMTLLTTISYLKEQLDEDFQFFRAGDLFVVLQQWRGMLFFVQTNEGLGAEILRFLLQTTREILIFLFGTRFENVMRRNISISKRHVYARYIDTYLNLCNLDHRFLLNALRYTNDAEEIQKFFIDKITPVPVDIPVKLISVLLMESHEIRTHFKNTRAVRLEPETISLLQIFVKVEFPDIDETYDPNAIQFDPEYVKSGASAKHKSAFLRIERTPVGCTLSLARCAEHSKTIIVVVTQNTKMPVPVQKQINVYMSEVCAFLGSLTFPKYVPPPTKWHEELLHFIIINRTEGDVWEMPYEDSLKQIMEYKHSDENLAKQTFHTITRKMASYAFNAMMHGYTTMMWGELDYQFCYEIRFLNDDDEDLLPTHVFTPPSFDDDNGVSYGLIVNSVFPSESGVRCFELLSIFRPSVRPKEAMEANDDLFKQFYQKVK